MLDLLGKRDEAVAAYKQAITKNLDVRHDQYGIVLDKKYVEKFLQAPFTRVENKYKNRKPSGQGEAEGWESKSSFPAKMPPPTGTAKKLILGSWQIQPSRANTWTFNADGTITITHPDNGTPAKGVYAWVSNDTVEIKAADEGPGTDKFEERVAIKSIDESTLVIQKPGQPESEVSFKRVSQ
jgi:hypothetical protein